MYKDKGDRKFGRKRFLFPVVMVLMLFVLAAAVQYLWNAIMPNLLHAGMLNYPKALGLLVLCRILFGKLHFGRPGGFGRRGGMHLNPNVRARFKDEFERRCKPPREYPVE